MKLEALHEIEEMIDEEAEEIKSEFRQLLEHII